MAAAATAREDVWRVLDIPAFGDYLLQSDMRRLEPHWKPGDMGVRRLVRLHSVERF